MTKNFYITLTLAILINFCSPAVFGGMRDPEAGGHADKGGSAHEVSHECRDAIVKDTVSGAINGAVTGVISGGVSGGIPGAAVGYVVGSIAGTVGGIAGALASPSCNPPKERHYGAER